MKKSKILALLIASLGTDGVTTPEDRGSLDRFTVDNSQFLTPLITKRHATRQVKHAAQNLLNNYQGGSVYALAQLFKSSQRSLQFKGVTLSRILIQNQENPRAYQAVITLAECFLTLKQNQKSLLKKCTKLLKEMQKKDSDFNHIAQEAYDYYTQILGF